MIEQHDVRVCDDIKSNGARHAKQETGQDLGGNGNRHDGAERRRDRGCHFGSDPITSFEDDNLDQFVNVDGSVDANGNPTLTIGDRLVAVLKYNQTFGVFGGGPAGFGADELTAISDITVISKMLSEPFGTSTLVRQLAGFSATSTMVPLLVRVPA